ncbi:UDP-GalNAc:beta-1,3-N-acetylgalactosaminyltransferase 1-like [Mizuhopecten yessoensis]|uniref:UDP-GalNAc:beta-1, 3-N-acetylgalactosaminyltransferase 1-like n=1 Tax=Mizuhopecten yessoensis TaxID=6573 RepID=UPI000B4592B9|nr:UDP-GalNAc:beta-1,3-N-acetylgalactosaminyltransferase 1-like [Mizuhopecten yessoensis]
MSTVLKPITVKRCPYHEFTKQIFPIEALWDTDAMMTLLSATLRSKRVRRAFLTCLLVSVVVVVLNRTILHDSDTLSVSDVSRLTELPEKQISKGILIHPKIKCSERCLQKTAILVISKASNTVQQETVRQTWGHPRMQSKYNFCLFFLLGKENNVDVNKISSANGDILQVNVTENYYSLTNKVMEGFNWVTHFCYEARFFFKTDDDVFFDLEFLKEIEKDNTYLSDDVLLGTCKRRTPVSRVVSKYHATYDEYPFEFYPPYCGGPGYFMTLNTARKIYGGMLYTKTFKLEDAYLGMVINRLGIPVKHVDNFIYALDNIDGYMQYFKIRCSRITHGLSASNIQQLWNQRSSIGIDNNDCSSWGKLGYIFKYYSNYIIGSRKDSFQISN